ncbi:MULTISPECIES: iron ABC transporter permease [unclassified Streptococcus]|uniref:FecCD family ABC transporter permease n=1 Tax=unclassified Streptococcus TaxID=2608887 RepID=UPI0011B63114|nr:MULTISPECIES: iron ABC transporter permease [unclassified Streptococcus]TWS94074.1 iron ABC transporter permease [Streptococcus sp. sy018]TWT14230.1 iron ABC transporter permease [Streptococcus sp. sy010]
MKTSPNKVIIFLFFVVLFTSILALSLGESQLNFTQLFNQSNQTQSQLILFNIRLPRILASLMGGGSLALAGLLLQTLTQNPLADSGILGINAGAGLVIASLLAFGKLEFAISQSLLPSLTILGSYATILLVYLLSYKPNHNINPNRLIIAGVGISTMMSSLIVTLVSYVDRYKIDYINNWLSGQITGDNWQSLLICSFPLVILWGLTYSQYQALNIMNLNEYTATALGLNLKKQRLFILFLATSLAAISVILVGNISFVGLIAGHSVKRQLGNNHLLTIPTSLMVGMLILLIADTLGRIFLVGMGIPTGLLVAIVGAPYFLYLMLKMD